MSDEGDLGKALCHVGVVAASHYAHGRIEADRDLEPWQKMLAHIGIAIVQTGAHVAVERFGRE